MCIRDRYQRRVHGQLKNIAMQYNFTYDWVFDWNSNPSVMQKLKPSKSEIKKTDSTVRPVLHPSRKLVEPHIELKKPSGKKEMKVSTNKKKEGGCILLQF
eukprot:TRINITY_DN3426_c0_g1_i6.p1 TRINITY_DN3426_c0_g1~~TRINITY_DN3426_c0_g1_i6.p1  ORF type:complete len:100 (-),score=30.05 TRINITY_DN3426_c0_g1_i6:23-322(-)